nr:hypothetical protein 4 [Gammaproteobacteria bacterium]
MPFPANRYAINAYEAAALRHDRRIVRRIAMPGDRVAQQHYQVTINAHKVLTAAQLRTACRIRCDTRNAVHS